MTEIMPSLQNLINLSYDPRRNQGGFFVFLTSHNPPS